MQVARSFPLDFVTPGVLKPSRRMRNNYYGSAAKSLTEIVGVMADRKVEEGDIEPDELEDNEGPKAQELRLDVLTQFLIMVVEKRLRGGEDAVEVVMGVAEKMGVEVEREVLLEAARAWKEVHV